MKKNLPKVKRVVVSLDLRWGDFNLFKNMGFSLEEEMPPIAYCFHSLKRRKVKPIENHVKNNIIYDCGHQKWVYLC
jgi:hypothetical protein